MYVRIQTHGVVLNFADCAREPETIQVILTSLIVVTCNTSHAKTVEGSGFFPLGGAVALASSSRLVASRHSVPVLLESVEVCSWSAANTEVARSNAVVFAVLL